ncbi:MAG TPA: hypothetical protein VMV10_18850 [Pirellulales bacterium]|nr:hypothetical protein [Pirellulales bacterium]
MSRTLLFLAILSLAASPAMARHRWRSAPEAPKAPAGAVKPANIEWQLDYAEAMKKAQSQQKMLLIWFQPARPSASSRQFETTALGSSQVRDKLEEFVALKVPADVKITVDGRETKVLAHPAFEELHGHAGVAILDFAHAEAPYYGRVVTALPFTPGKYYRFQPKHLAVALELPPGTITQRTMVFAVRIHPEAPASTRGELDPALTNAARQHSQHQARIRLQGHHNWGSRFPRLSALLPFGLRAQEVVAESWPHETMVDAAVDCVDSWRQSSGHWSAVRARQPRFGYDMQRGSNGIWYATGLFGNYH